MDKHLNPANNAEAYVIKKLLRFGLGDMFVNKGNFLRYNPKNNTINFFMVGLASNKIPEPTFLNTARILYDLKVISINGIEWFLVDPDVVTNTYETTIPRLKRLFERLKVLNIVRMGSIPYLIYVKANIE